jgi:hypothetical protein
VISVGIRQYHEIYGHGTIPGSSHLHPYIWWRYRVELRIDVKLVRGSNVSLTYTVDSYSRLIMSGIGVMYTGIDSDGVGRGFGIRANVAAMVVGRLVTT